MSEENKSNQVNQPKKKQVKKRPEKSSENYRQHYLQVEKISENVFHGKTWKAVQNQDLGQPIHEYEGKNYKEVMVDLKKELDQLLGPEITSVSTQESTHDLVSSSNNKPTIESVTCPDIPVEVEVAKDNHTLQSEDNLVVKKSEISSVVDENQDSKCFQLLTENHNTFIKEFEAIKRHLGKLESTISVIQNEILPNNKNPNLPNRINRIIKSNIDEWRREDAEKKQIQENLLRDILSKINTVAQAEIVYEVLSNLQAQSKDLNNRLDAKIDLQDAQKVLNLRNEIERFVHAEVIKLISQKIMPVIEILKDQVDGKDSVIMKSVAELEQRCKQAGLISMDNLF